MEGPVNRLVEGCHGVAHGQADRRIEAFPFRANVTARIDNDDRWEALHAKVCRCRRMRVESDVLQRVAARELHRDFTRFSNVNRDDDGARDGFGATLDERQLDFTRPAPARIKIEKDDLAALSATRNVPPSSKS